MSKLAKKIAPKAPAASQPVRHGPLNRCFPLYGVGDLEDWEALEGMRHTPGKDGKMPTWRQVQATVDSVAGVDRPIPLEKFKYHWRRFCYCWPEDLRR